MHKKLEADLMSLAHQILQLKDKDDVVKLKNKAKELHEKLSVLDFVNNYFLTNPKTSKDKKEVLKTVEASFESKNSITQTQEEIKKELKKVAKEVIQKPKKEKKVEAEQDMSLTDEKFSSQNAKALKDEANKIVNKILEQETAYVKNDVKDIAQFKKSLANNEEFKDSIPADVAADLFEKASKLDQVKPTKTTKPPTKKENVAVKVPQKSVTTSTAQSSVNDSIYKQKLQIGLNDRIAFVKHLFNFSQEDFNRVLSQLNTFQTEKEATDFIKNRVKPEYNWIDKEEYENRLLALIERKFL